MTDQFADLSLYYTDFALAFVFVIAGRELIRRLARARRVYLLVYATLYVIVVASIIGVWVLRVISGEFALGWLLLAVTIAVALATAVDSLAHQHRATFEEDDPGDTE